MTMRNVGDKQQVTIRRIISEQQNDNKENDEGNKPEIRYRRVTGKRYENGRKGMVCKVASSSGEEGAEELNSTVVGHRLIREFSSVL